MTSDVVTIYGFSDNDRSGKVRWTACELGLPIEEKRLGIGEHRQPPYLELNPLAQIPTVIFRGQVWIESTCTCQLLAESFDEPKLWVGPGEPERASYLFWISVFAETLEGRLVESALTKFGILPGNHHELHEPVLRSKLAALAAKLPAEGYLCGRFTVADIVAGYSLRLALQLDLVPRERVLPYVERLRARPAARESRIFASLDAG
ncbi:MAG TPA: glutathione S-transferase family protein [Sandaracinaceae bacterium]